MQHDHLMSDMIELSGAAPEQSTRILIVEDEPILRTAFAHFLEEAGYDVYGTKDIILGLDLCESVIPDLVLIDRDMPHLKGQKMTSVQAFLNIRPDIKVIAFSRYDSAQPVRIYVGGMSYMLDEPLRPKHLVTVVRGVTGFKNATRADRL